MRRLIKALLMLLVLAGIGVVAYALLGDLSPEQELVQETVELDAQN